MLSNNGGGGSGSAAVAAAAVSARHGHPPLPAPPLIPRLYVSICDVHARDFTTHK